MGETYTGLVQNGVIVPDEGTPRLPEGTKVRFQPAGLSERPGEVNVDPMLATRAWLLGLAREAEADPEAHTLPADLAEHHDHYAHGRPRT